MSALDKLARQLNRMERTIQDLAAAPQLAYSSVEEGGSVDVYNNDDVLVASFGGQYDGTYGAVSLSGPKPPTPSNPIAVWHAGFVSVSWDGNFLDGGGEVDFTIPAPLDFARVEVHLGSAGFVPDLLPESATRKATIEAPGGASVAVGASAGDYETRLVVRSLSGAASDASGAVSGSVSAVITDADRAELEAAIGQAAQDASNAQSAAHDASAKADAAQSAASAATTLALGKSKTTYSTSSPSNPSAYSEGDTWFQTDASGNAASIYRLAAGSWTLVPISGATLATDSVTSGQISASAITAAELAASAVTTGKIANGAVTANELAVGSITADKVQAGAIGAAAIAAGAITTDKLTAGAVTANELAAGSIVTSKIAAGAITSGEIAAGSLVADHFTAGSVTADAIDSGVINADKLSAVIALVTRICSAESGRRWEQDSSGIRMYDTDGSLILNFPTDASQLASITADLVASSLTVMDQLALRGTNNEISKGGRLSLSSGTTSPTSPVQATFHWPSIDTNVSETNDSTYASLNSTRYGWVWWQNKWWTAQGVYGQSATLESYEANGDRTALQTPIQTAISAPTSVAVVGSTIYVMGSLLNASLQTEWWCEGYSSAGVRVSRWKMGTNANFRKCFILSDGTNSWVAYSATTNPYLLFNPTNLSTGAGAGSQITTNLSISKDLTFAWVGAGDFGAQRFVVGVEGSQSTVVMNASGQVQANESWPLPSASVRGMVFDSGVFKSHDPNAHKLYSHSATKWTTESPAWRIMSTWHDPDPAGGTHETAPGPAASVVAKKRAWLDVTVPPIPSRPLPNTTDDVTASRVYISRGFSGLSGAELVGSVAAPGRVLSLGAITLPNGGVATNPPPSASNFPVSSPASITSADGTKLVISGDGTGMWGNLVVTSTDTRVVSWEGTFTGSNGATNAGTLVRVTAGVVTAGCQIGTLPALAASTWVTVGTMSPRPIATAKSSGVIISQSTPIMVQVDTSGTVQVRSATALAAGLSAWFNMSYASS